jgi:hypothetical protein
MSKYCELNLNNISKFSLSDIEIINGNYIIWYCYTYINNSIEYIFIDNCGNLYYKNQIGKYLTATKLLIPLNNHILKYISYMDTDRLNEPIEAIIKNLQPIISLLLKQYIVTDMYSCIENVYDINLYYEDSYIIYNFKEVNEYNCKYNYFNTIIIDNYGFIYIKNSSKRKIINRDYVTMLHNIHKYKLADKYIEFINIFIENMLKKTHKCDNTSTTQNLSLSISELYDEITSVVHDILELNIKTTICI